MKGSIWITCLLVLAVAIAAIPAAAQQPATPAPTPDQVARQSERTQKLNAADRVVARDEAQLGRKADTKIRARIVTALADNKSLAEIDSIPAGTSISLGLSLIFAVTPDAPGIGDLTDNLVYYPVTPCRVIDTRFIGSGAPIVPGANRNFIVVTSPLGANTFAPQGGSAGNCGTTWPGPAAAMLNVVAVGPGAVGDLRITPFGSPIPNASAINYIPGQNVANGIVQAICQGCGFDITVQADSAPTHMVVDILGYFMFPTTPITQNLFAAVNADGSLARGFRATSSTSLGTGVYEVDFDRVLTNCTFVATVGPSTFGGSSPASSVTVAGRAGNTSGVFLATFNQAGAATNLPFHLIVMCPAAPSSP